MGCHRLTFALLLLTSLGCCWPAALHAQRYPGLYRTTAFADGLAWVQSDEGRKWELINTEGKRVRKLNRRPMQLNSFSEGLAAAEFSAGWGYVDLQGEIKIPPGFELAGPFHEQRAWVLTADGYGVIDTSGAFIVKPGYVTVGSFVNGMAPVRGDSLWGFIDRSGREVVPRKFYEVRPFENGLAAASDAVAWGYINPKGEWVLEPQFSYLDNFTHDDRAVAAAFQVDTLTLIDTAFEAIPLEAALMDSALQDQFTSLDSLARNMVVTRGYMLRLKSVDTLTQLRYEDDSLYGYIDRAGVFQIPPRFTAARPFHENLAAARQDSTWGFLTPAGRWAIAPSFDRAMDFSEGLAPIQQGKKWGYVDPTGDIVIAPRFDEASPFRNGLAAVRLDGGLGWINPQGRLVVGR